MSQPADDRIVYDASGLPANKTDGPHGTALFLTRTERARLRTGQAALQFNMNQLEQPATSTWCLECESHLTTSRYRSCVVCGEKLYELEP